MVKRLRRHVFTFILIMFGVHVTGSPVTGQTASADTSDSSPHSEASLASTASAVAPGQRFTVALDIEMEEGWHTYWINPGDSGEPVTIEWSLPDGVEARAFEWPYPRRIDASVLTSYGYADRVLLPTSVSASGDLAVGDSITIRGEASWLICADICLPASATVESTFPVAAEPVAASPAEVRRVEQAQARVPTVASDWTFEATRSEGSYGLAFTVDDGKVPDISSAQFFPEDGDVLDHAAAQPLTRQEDAFLMALQESPYAQTPADTLRGVLVAPSGASWIPGEEVRAIRVHAPVVEDGAGTLSILEDGLAASTGSGGGRVAIGWALLMAFAGGLLLNLMPCVFPVLSIKILGFADSSGDDPTAMRRHGWLFGAGVLVSMWVLAGTLLGLRAAGNEIGWGFQLQSPAFVALMALLFAGIGYNLLGAFEVGTTLMNWGGRLQGTTPDSGNRSAFMTGILATIIATPCTAPFMGAALGVALASSAPGAVAIFTMLGAGMATPYVGLSMTPRLLDRLPEPGAWMESLKQFFAFPMFATAIWLLWVFAQQTGHNAVALLLFAILLLGVASWILNRWSAATLSRTARVATRAVVAAIIAGAVTLALVGAQYDRARSASTSTPNGDARWMSYSAERVDSLRSTGRPIFIDFTAAWCLTCQVNKQTVLSTPEVTEAFEQSNVALIRADWTNRDADITKALASHGRSGVPVYVYYAGPNARPEILPEVLTKDMILDRLNRGT
jgi:thiol:disulfide interchange protein DsbD